MSSGCAHILYHTEARRPDGASGYETALSRAAASLSGTNPDDLARRAGAEALGREGARIIELDFLGDRVAVDMPGGAVRYAAKGGEPPLWARILILHYLAGAGGAPPRGVEATFRDLPGGREYFPAFERRAIAPFVAAFGRDPERFIEAGLAAGGTRADKGGHALRFRAFPRVEVTLVLWPGDDEFPPSGSAIFDASISDYLSTEDVAVLCNMLAITIARAGEKGA